MGAERETSTGELLAAWRQAARALEQARPNDPDRGVLEAQVVRAARAYHARVEADVAGHRLDGNDRGSSTRANKPGA